VNSNLNLNLNLNLNVNMQLVGYMRGRATAPRRAQTKTDVSRHERFHSKLERINSINQSRTNVTRA
jgi:hypothetical protein